VGRVAKGPPSSRDPAGCLLRARRWRDGAWSQRWLSRAARGIDPLPAAVLQRACSRSRKSQSWHLLRHPRRSRGSITDRSACSKARQEKGPAGCLLWHRSLVCRARKVELVWLQAVKKYSAWYSTVCNFDYIKADILQTLVSMAKWPTQNVWNLHTLRAAVSKTEPTELKFSWMLRASWQSQAQLQPATSVFILTHPCVLQPVVSPTLPQFPTAAHFFLECSELAKRIHRSSNCSSHYHTGISRLRR